MDESQAGRNPSRRSSRLGRLAWVMVPAAAVVAYMLLRPEPPPASSIDADALRGHSGQITDDMDRYAQPTEPKPAAGAPAKAPLDKGPAATGTPSQTPPESDKAKPKGSQ